MADVVQLLRESLDPKLDPIEVAKRIDGAYEVFERNDKQRIEFPREQAREILSLLAYGHVSDVESEGAGSSSPSSKCSNPRLLRFEERFGHVAEMTGLEANWDEYLQEARRTYRSKPRKYGQPGERTIRSGRFGAPRQKPE